MAEQKSQNYQVTERQRKNAWYISLALLVVQASVIALLLVQYAGQIPLGILASFGVNVVSSIASAWLARKGRSVLGIQILLAVQIGSAFLVVLQNGGIGLPVSLFLLTLTFWITSSTLPQKLATRYNVAAGVVSVIAILLDIFQPFERITTGNTTISWALSGGLALVLIVLILRQFRSYTLRTKLTLAFLLVSLVMVLSFLAVANLNMKRALTHIAEQTLMTNATMVGASLDDYLQHNITIANTAASFTNVRSLTIWPEQSWRGTATETNAQNLLYSIATRDPEILSVAILNADGINILDSHLNNVGNDESDLLYFQPAYQDRLRYVSPILYLPEQEPSFFVSVPIQDDTSEVQGVLRIQYKSSALQNYVVERGELTGPFSFSVLFDDVMIIQAHEKRPELVGHILAPLSAEKIAELRADHRLPVDVPDSELSLNLPDAAAQLDNLSHGLIFTGDNPSLEGPITGAAVSIRTVPWIATSVQPQKVFLAPLQAMSRSLLLTALVLTGVAGLLSIGVTQAISAPIVRLTEVASRFAEGDLTARTQVESEDEIGTLARTFNGMAAQLRGVLSTLEQRIAERTRALETSTEVSRRLSTILDPDELVREVVEQVKSAFDYYHAHIYLLDKERGVLVMAGGTGEAGQTMLERGHSIPKGKGLVGRAADTNLPILVPDVSKEEGWLPNPLLPETRSEAAIPIAIGDQVIGVLDVQENTIGGLTENDVTLLQSIANQVAIALQNAEAYRNTQQRAEREAMVARIIQQIQSTTEIEDALKVTARELGRVLDTGVSVKLQTGPEDE